MNRDDRQAELRRTSSEMIVVSNGRLASLGAGSATRRGSDALLDQRLEALRSVVGDAQDLAENVRAIFAGAVEVYLVSKELDAMIEQFRIASNTSLARLRVVAPITERQLERASDRVDRLLDQVSAIDARSCSKEDLDHRNALIQLAAESSRQINQALMRLMSI